MRRVLGVLSWVAVSLALVYMTLAAAAGGFAR
jgi:hypothetical protein